MTKIGSISQPIFIIIHSSWWQPSAGLKFWFWQWCWVFVCMDNMCVSQLILIVSRTCAYACAGRKRSGWIGWTTRSGWETWSSWNSRITGQITSWSALHQLNIQRILNQFLIVFGFVGWPRKTRGSWTRCEYFFSSLKSVWFVSWCCHYLATNQSSFQSETFDAG